MVYCWGCESRGSCNSKHNMFLVVSFPSVLLHSCVAIFNLLARRHRSSVCAVIAFCQRQCSVLLLKCGLKWFHFRIVTMIHGLYLYRSLGTPAQSCFGLPSVGSAVSGFVWGRQDALFPALAVNRAAELSGVMCCKAFHPQPQAFAFMRVKPLYVLYHIVCSAGSPREVKETEATLLNCGILVLVDSI